jgi:transcriptional regulator with XRE-family HTH domain
LAALGGRLRLARKRRRLSAVQAAECMGVARDTLYRLERGDGAVSVGVLLRALRVLGLDADIDRLAADDVPELRPSGPRKESESVMLANANYERHRNGPAQLDSSVKRGIALQVPWQPVLARFRNAWLKRYGRQLCRQHVLAGHTSMGERLHQELQCSVLRIATTATPTPTPAAGHVSVQHDRAHGIERTRPGIAIGARCKCRRQHALENGVRCASVDPAQNGASHPSVICQFPRLQAGSDLSQYNVQSCR